MLGVRLHAEGRPPAIKQSRRSAFDRVAVEDGSRGFQPKRKSRGHPLRRVATKDCASSAPPARSATPCVCPALILLGRTACLVAGGARRQQVPVRGHAPYEPCLCRL